jgi:hypothetical protein
MGGNVRSTVIAANFIQIYWRLTLLTSGAEVYVLIWRAVFLIEVPGIQNS